MLLGALDQPQWRHYRTLQAKAGVLHYCLNCDHPFVDGNKRFAVAAMEMFLFLNRAQLCATDDEVTAFALGVAKGEIDRSMCAEFLRRRVTRITWDDEQIVRWWERMPPEDRAGVRDIVRSWAEGTGTTRWLRIQRALKQVLRGTSE